MRRIIGIIFLLLAVTTPCVTQAAEDQTGVFIPGPISMVANCDLAKPIGIPTTPESAQYIGCWQSVSNQSIGISYRFDCQTVIQAAMPTGMTLVVYEYNAYTSDTWALTSMWYVNTAQVEALGQPYTVTRVAKVGLMGEIKGVTFTDVMVTNDQRIVYRQHTMTESGKAVSTESKCTF